MVTIERFSKLVTDIYAAAIAPDQWVPTLREMHSAFDGISAALCVSTGALWSIEDSNLPTEAAGSYAAYFCRHDHVLDRLQTEAVGAIRTGAELIDRRTDFYTDWMKPNRLEDGLFVRLTAGASPTCVVVASARGDRNFASRDRVRLLTALVPHLQQSVAMRTRLTALDHTIDDLSGALEMVRYAIAVVDADRVVANLNSSAESLLRSADGLTVCLGRLTASNAANTAELHSAVVAATIGDDIGVRGGQSFTCTRPSGKRPFVVHVSPLPVTGLAVPRRRPAAAVLVVDPEHEPEPAEALLRRLYRLTPSEAEVALHVMHGADLRQVADRLSVSLATVRTHLQRVFDKTDTHRQAQLVRLLHAIDPPAGLPASGRTLTDG